MQRSKRSLPLALLCVLLIAALAGCVPPVPTPGATPGPTLGPTPSTPPTQQPTATPAGSIEDNCQAYAEKGKAMQREVTKGQELPAFEGLMYVEGQVLLGGNRQAIADLVGKGGLPLRPSRKDSTIPAGEEVIQQFDITDPRASVEYITCVVNAYAERDGMQVYADPNYAVTPAAWHGGGSPWTQNGAWAQPGGGLGSTDLTGFLAQWALGEKGIALFDSSGKRAVPAEGEGAMIGVFDTSPFLRAPAAGAIFESVFLRTLSNRGSNGGQLIVHDAQPQNIPSCPGRDRRNPVVDRERFDLSSHGLFVAGLAHAVAPQSDIYLVRVLQDDACGDLATILRGLQWFQEEMARRGQPMEKTVVNLSLGLNRPDAATAHALGLPGGPEVRTLQAKIRDLVDKGATVVAAAGNDSFDQATAGEAEVPALDRGVIGVAASTIEQRRGCFSNEGDLAAPGGDGVGSDYRPSDRRLGPDGATPDCNVPAQIPSVEGEPAAAGDPWVCELDATPCVVSLVWRNGKPAFAYWVGTSFATPLVSGLAALAIETKQPGQTTAEVIAAGLTPVNASESLGRGIVNVDKSIGD